MTTATISTVTISTVTINTATINTVRATGLDGLAIRLGTALATWGRVRAQRTTVDHEQAANRLRTEQTIARRQHATTRYGIAS